MCGRFAQIDGLVEFLNELASKLEVQSGYDGVPIARYNVPPQTLVKILRSDKQSLVIDQVQWGWKPAWAKDIHPTINARSEKVASSKFYTQIWPNRCLIPANGWFEWVKGGNGKQPYYIHLKDRRPMFFAGLGYFKERSDNDGFVIVTADAVGGMLDIHDRRPVVLSPQYANEWLNPETDSARAEEILFKHSRAAADFSWYPVSKAVGNVRNQGEGLIQPITS